MKIIFLDFDGVLNNWASIAENVHLVSEKCILIRRICKETGAKIVISSTWRMGDLMSHLSTMLWRVGGPYNTVIGCTPVIQGIRGNEIKEWMVNYGLDKIESYVILDDDSDMLEEQKPFFIQTHMNTGLTTRDALKAIKLLGKADEDDTSETSE